MVNVEFANNIGDMVQHNQFPKVRGRVVNLNMDSDFTKQNLIEYPNEHGYPITKWCHEADLKPVLQD